MDPKLSDAAMTQSARRVGDRQRGEYAETLADAFARGELSRTEFEERAELCLSAVTDADLARLVGDLQDRRAEHTGNRTARPSPSRAGVHLTKIVVFQSILIVIAFVLGVDLESELRSWFFIAFELWLVGTVAGAAGALLLRRSGTRRLAD